MIAFAMLMLATVTAFVVGEWLPALVLTALTVWAARRAA